MSIVLVVIGLIVGGILVGQDLIRAAGVRAQLSQIEKFNTAANTFKERTGYLPGDIPAIPAAQFGLATRGSYPGEGDGDGIIAGNYTSNAVGILGSCEGIGETAMFWVDLSATGLIDGGFNTASAYNVPSSGWGNNVPGSLLSAFFPTAKLGGGNFIYVYSGGWFGAGVWHPNDVNYFGISVITSLFSNGFYPVSTPGLTVLQAYNIDQKVDDGLPQTGRVTAQYLLSATQSWVGASDTSATAGSATTCYDNGSSSTGATQQYSVKQNNGAGVNCALSFKMQAGD